MCLEYTTNAAQQHPNDFRGSFTCGYKSRQLRHGFATVHLTKDLQRCTHATAKICPPPRRHFWPAVHYYQTQPIEWGCAATIATVATPWLRFFEG